MMPRISFLAALIFLLLALNPSGARGLEETSLLGRFGEGPCLGLESVDAGVMRISLPAIWS